MTCASPRLLPDAAKRSSGAVACPQVHKLVVVAAGKQRHRPHRRRSRGAKPAATLKKSRGSGDTSQHAATAAARLPTVSSTRRPSAAAKKPFNTTVPKAKLESRSTGALPVLPSLCTAVEGGAAASARMPPTKGGPKRRDFHSRLDEYRHSGNDRPLRKQRRENHGNGSKDAGGGGGPVKIWCCPSTSSLYEEACADLRGMARPGLWRAPRHLSEEVRAGHHQLDKLKQEFKADRKRREANVKGGFLSLLQTELIEGERERWMGRRALLRADCFTVEQRRELREWFDSLDTDGSGEIDVSELSQPLLCTGLARSAFEVGHLVRQVDKDGSGEIGFKEFLAVLRPKGVVEGKSAIQKIVHLQDVKKAHGSDMQTVVATARRALLIKEILDEGAFRSSVADDVEQKRFVAQLNGDSGALKVLRAREERLERRRVQKNLFIQAVSDASDFQQELEKVNEVALQKARKRRKKKRSLSSAADALLPSRHLKPRSNNSRKASSGVRFSEPEAGPAPARGDYGGARNSGATTSGDSAGVGAAAVCSSSSGGAAGGGGGGVNGSGASAFATFASSPEVRALLGHEQHRLEHRRLLHHNFRRRGVAEDLEGADGVVGSRSRSPPGIRGQGGPGGGSGSGATASAPVRVTASVEVSRGRNVEACSPLSPSPSPSKGGTTDTVAAGILSGQATPLEPPLRAGGGRSGRSRKGSRGRSVSFAKNGSGGGGGGGSSSSCSSARRASQTKTSSSRACLGSGSGDGSAHGAGGPDEMSPDGGGTAGHLALANKDYPTAVTTGSMEGSAGEGSAGSPAVVKAEAPAGERKRLKAASYSDAADAVDDVSVGGRREGTASDAADWYRQSKLSAASRGGARIALATASGGGGGTARVDQPVE